MSKLRHGRHARTTFTSPPAIVSLKQSTPSDARDDRMEFSPPNLGVIICSHVYDASRPILLVTHDDEGWNFACGHHDHRGAEDFHVAGVGHLIERDPSINQCADLPVGHLAERASVDSRWTRNPIDDIEQGSVD